MTMQRPTSTACTGEPAEGTDDAALRPRLLIVDDVADNRAILARRFMRRGYDVHEADGGALALAMVAAENYDAVLLDVMMPGIDGLEVLRRIRSTYSQIDLPVIMVTAKSQSEDVVEALGLKANDYVTKPVDFEIALARVSSQIDRKRAEEKIKHANAALQQVNEQLEERIAERTVELVEINRKLKGEIDQRVRSEAETRFLALHDPLTGLANRVMFREDLEKALTASDVERDPIAVFFIDLDGFKSVNDTLGHAIGDLLLTSIGQDLKTITTAPDRAARLGGDEFAILHHVGRRPESITALAERILDIASRSRRVDGQTLTVSASIGIAVSTERNETPGELLRNADLAMYKAKADGRGTFRIYDPEMGAKVQERRSLELDMVAAFANGQYRVYYQPLVSLKSNRVCAFEALLRWEHPERGMISPAEFVPIAEETGLIVQLGDWVLRQACREAAAWPDDIRIAVNVSPVQFTRGNVVSSTVGALASSGLRPGRLEIEITESVLLERSEQSLATLEQLRDLGVRIAMDDFGTGYSSLGYLRRFQFDKIKIDQSFIRDIVQNADNNAIVQAIAILGHKFGISTTAEGVETQEQLLRVTNEGCTEAQGWIFSPPMPAGQIPDFIQRQDPERLDLLRA